MAIEFKDGKYVDPQTGRVTLDPTVYKDWQIAEEAEKNLPPVDYFREKLGLLPEEIIPYGKTPKIEAIHAGLECGLFAGQLPGLDCVSFGPDLADIHTTREKMSISSVQRTWRFLLGALEALKD